MPKITFRTVSIIYLIFGAGLFPGCQIQKRVGTKRGTHRSTGHLRTRLDLCQAPRPDFGVVPSWEPGGSAFLLLVLNNNINFQNFRTDFSCDHPIMPRSQLGSCGWMPHPPGDLGRGNRGLGDVSGASRAGHSPPTAFLPGIPNPQNDFKIKIIRSQITGSAK